ncbi:hypothetical protein LBMAG42_01330 [Deltaproteobacteria bacterium]|nr:hypothetical protein LBMAG42_01330 [Deltaproteobacteria bacterium]
MRKIQVLLVLSGLLALGLSLVLMLNPQAFFAGQGLTLDAGQALVGRAQGTLLFGFAILNFSALGAGDGLALRPVMAGNLATHLAALGVNAFALSSGLANESVYGDVGVHVVFGAAFAYFLARPPAR